MEENQDLDQTVRLKQRKFIKSDQHSELLRTIIDKENRRKSRSSINSTFNPACLTECPRRIMYRCSGVDHSSPTSYLDIQTSIAAKKKWSNILDNCKELKVLEENVVAADYEFNITGNVDIVLRMDEEIYETQIKSIDSETFSRVQQKGALKKDVVETLVYIWLTEIENGLLIYDNKNDGGFLLFHVTPYQPIIKSVKAKCEKLTMQKVEGGLPERPYESGTSNECKVCEFLSMCW